MIGYILMGLGAYLIADDYIKSREKKGETDENISENGRDRRRGNSDRKQNSDGEKRDRHRVLGVPTEKGGSTNGKFHNGPIQQSQLDKDRRGAGDDLRREPDTTSKRRKAKGVKPAENSDGEGGDDESNSQNGISNDGNNVRLEHAGEHEPDSQEANQGVSDRASDE